MEGGISGIVKAALYKPLSNKDHQSIINILFAAEKLFRLIAYVFVLYMIGIAVVFPFFINEGYNYIFVSSLVLIVGIGVFAQYYFGITYQILLQADQKWYITSLLQASTLIVNTIITVVLIKLNTNIHIIKIANSLVFIIRPLILLTYVKHKYNLQKNKTNNNYKLSQKWDGIGHHFAYFLHNTTDVIVITLFINVVEVSVYSIYSMIVVGIRSLIMTFTSGIEAAFGNMIANDEKEILNKNFELIEFISFFVTTVLFTSSAILILSFIAIYTNGVNDTNYIRPMFAYTLIISEAIYCIRIPYHSLISAAGHFKQTRNGAFIEAFINISLSIILVSSLGLLGVALGTLIAMLFRTLQYVYYLSKNIINRKMVLFFGKLFINMIGVVMVLTINNLLNQYVPSNYAEWFVYAVIVTIFTTTILGVFNLIFYYNLIIEVVKIFKRMFSVRFQLK
ncbi:lipopolysaccharide biosynthesis protein [Paracholeplasma manati]|uniref:lipopolysaccharide biosynthesis protein n=1 Tax=Paracholeplasma manati TaxID=591373 RepID=UPI002407B05E|nr:polysaccharide biosynthesis C-terminal domain-containing protein [Paracholeplasma manati]MDG0888955.1 polysaccharide biosynthesis C-terminal domain-containing protein [Paracholeplasma manati]